MRKFIGLALLALTACGSADTSETTQIGDTTLTNNEAQGSSTIKNADGYLTATEGAANVTFPDIAPQYPGSTITGSIESAGKDKRVKTMVNLSTTDSVEKVGEYYRGVFKTHGLNIGMNMVTPEAVMINADKDTAKVNVMAGTEEGKTVISMSFSGV